jgi:hypothetical protein
MMLLQAGQLGLYRKDSIWTSEIPPDMVAGATMWIDFTDTTTLWSNTDFTGTNVTTDGASVGSAKNKIDTGIGLRKSSEPILLKTPAANGSSAATFNTASVTARMELSNLLSAEATSTILTASTKLIFAAVRVAAAGVDQGSPWVNDSVFADSAGYFGLHLTDDSDPAGKLTARAFNYVSASNTVSALFPRNAWVVLTMSHQSGQLRLRVNGGAWVTTTSGNTTSMGGQGLVGHTPTSSARNFDLAHLATFNTAQTDAAISAVERWIANDLGITPW